MKFYHLISSNLLSSSPLSILLSSPFSSPFLFSPLCSPLPSSLHAFPTSIIILTAKDISSLYNFVQFTQPIIHILNYNSLQFTQPIIHNLNPHLQVTVSHNPKQRPWLQNCEPLWQMQGHQNHLVYEVSRSK